VLLQSSIDGEAIWEYKEESKSIHQEIIDAVGGEERFRKIVKIQPINESSDNLQNLDNKVLNQQKMYSEEDIKSAFLDGWMLRDGDLPFPKAKKKWFNKFKNK
jgi:hypothetical protein